MMLVVPIGSVADYMQLACERVHDVAGNSDVGSHQRMVSDEVNGLFDRCIGFFKSVEPSREVYAAVFHERDVLFAYASLPHEVEHLLCIHALHSAAGVANYHYFVDAKLIYGYEQRTHGGVKRVGDCAACVFDDFDIAVANAERRGKQLDKAGVHTRYYGYLLVGKF